MKRFFWTVLGIALGILSIAAAISLGLALIHVFDVVYRFDIRALNVSETSGYSVDVILRNYHAVMQYLTPFNHTPFSLPDLAYSVSGAQHFTDVKVVFNGFYVAGTVSILLFFAAMLFFRQNRRRLLRASGITTLALPVALIGFVAIDFSSAFILFHEIFFSNELWWFDPVTDPIITILPAEFFMHCAIVIALFIMVAAVIQLLFSKKRRSRLLSNYR